MSQPASCRVALVFSLLLAACSSGGHENEPGASGGGGATSSSSVGSGGTGGTGGVGGGVAGGPPGFTLVWSDEFEGASGSPVDTSKWTALVGGEGWGNQELEYYTADALNAHVDNGSLLITATTEGTAGKNCWYGACQFTSARLQTKGQFEQAQGRFEARIQVPAGQGIWPAFWMLGGNIDAAGWPGCGEIDIMENIGKEPAIVHGSLHGPGYSGGNPLTGSYTLPNGALADAYHVYAVEWDTDAIRFYLDDVLYETRTPADVPAGSTWVYDHPFFLLLNVAVGGGWPGSPDGTTMFPQSMRVDYVRVYKRT